MKTSRPGSRKHSKPSPSCDPYGNPLQSPSKQNYGSSIQMSKQCCSMAQKPGKSPPTSPRRSRPSLTNVSGGSSILSGSTECQTPSCGQGRSRNQWSSRSGEESGDGLATSCAKSLPTSLGKRWNGTRRERGNEGARSRHGGEAYTVNWAHPT